MSSVTTVHPAPPPVICDYGWYYGTVSSPQRLSGLSYTVGTSSYPPAATTVAGGSVTLPTNSNITVASTARLESTGWVTFYGGNTNHTSCPYTVVDGTHIACTGGSGTFATGTPVYDPRFYVDSMPLRQQVIFDAIDFNNLGLPKLTVPPGISIVLYQWNFGNGQTGFGPYASVTYPFSKPVASIQTSLTVFDNLGRSFSCAKRLNHQSLSPVYVTSLRQIKATGTSNR